MEAHDRAVSGRFTIDQIAQMLKDFGFPFAGQGTPGEQLLGFLRVRVGEAQAAPDAPESFTPLFISAMVGKQKPAVDLTNSNTLPGDVRLTLLEIELLFATFDRAIPNNATGVVTGKKAIRFAAVPTGACDNLSKLLGNANFVGEKAVGYVREYLTDGSLKLIGMSESDVKVFNTTTGAVLKAFDSAMKVVKLIQIYSSAHAVLTIIGNDPVRKPEWHGPRTLQGIKATIGVPDQDWQAYQQNNGSQTYKDVKSCLSYLGMPLPYDLKDMASKIGGWRVDWQPTTGTPEHAFISDSNVNTFDAAFSGHPYAMKLRPSGAASAEAILMMDINEEPYLSTLFQGPLVQSPVTVKVATYIAEPPSPALLAGTVSLAGTVASLVDLTVGWIQTAFPPTSSITYQVEYHDLPVTIQASAQIDMKFNPLADIRDTTRSVMSLVADWSAELTRDPNMPLPINAPSQTVLPIYRGTGTFNYQSQGLNHRL